MAATDWDWFQREELIGQISDLRVQNLQVERVRTQKRTFTRWINFHLERCKPPLEVRDLFRDMQDGKVLMALLEVLSGHKLMHQYKHSRHRIFRLNNIARALKFLEDGYVKLVSIDAPEIADGNPSMILGLIWNIILRFQIKEAAGHLKIFSMTNSLSSLHNGSESDLTEQPASLQEAVPLAPYKDQRKVIKALLKWVQRATAKYGVAVQDFGSSWRSGIAFLALIKAVKPSLVDMAKAMERPSRVNLEDAFKIAEDSLEIPPLLEPEDVDVERPEEQSIATYVSQFLEHFPYVDENNLAEGASELPLDNSHFSPEVMPSNLGVQYSSKSQEEELNSVLSNGSYASANPTETVHTSQREEMVDDIPLPDEVDHVLDNENRGSEREASPSSIPNAQSSTLYLDNGPPSSDLHSPSSQHSPDSTETIEEIYVVLHPVRRKTSTGEKILVLGEDPTSPVSLDRGSPVSANDVFTVVPDVEASASSVQWAGDASSETSVQKGLVDSYNSSNSQPHSLRPVDLQAEASTPARNRTVSESGTQTDEKPSSRQNEQTSTGIGSILQGDEKVSVIPLNLVYYPHYDVPVSEVLEAFSVTGTSQKDFIPRIQTDKELSPLTDEAYQSCSEFSGTFSLQELSPTSSDYALCSPDTDQVDTLSYSSLSETREVVQPSSSLQGTETAEFVPEAKTGIPSELAVVCQDELSGQPTLHHPDAPWEGKSSGPNNGDLQVPEGGSHEDEEERHEGSEEVGAQQWDLQTNPRDRAEEIGEEEEGSGSETELVAIASSQQLAEPQSTELSSSTVTRTVEDVRDANSYDPYGLDQELPPEVVDEDHLNLWHQHTSEQDQMKSLLEPGTLLPDEHSRDLLMTAAEQDEQHEISNCQLPFNEPKATEQTSMETGSALESCNPTTLTFASQEASIKSCDETPLDLTAHPHLPYLIVLLWMAVYWMIILLHLDLETVGLFASS
ncbi:calmin-like isoform X1 [Hypanus sabinus]|uniref:calmin-like isoform X1 n=2 Tax=Hypanus sabinus TaxID=79690 RepID=UPI0028C44F42|nr:calmin-like isoform X1 [Hypanus sabinus]